MSGTIIAIGAGIAVLGSFGAGIGIGIATGRASEATAIYGFVIALMIIVMLA